MPTVSDAARVTVKAGAVWRTCGRCGVMAALPPEVDRCASCIRAAELEDLAAFFDPEARSDIHFAGCVFAAALEDIAHHEIGDPGVWDCYGTVPQELLRLRAALSRMEAAIKQTRTELTVIERRARFNARRAAKGR